jgi:hypothetical protein
MLDWPENIKVEVPEEAKEAADEYIEQVAHDDGEGTARALVGLVADASDFLPEYEEAFGTENIQPLETLVSDIRTRVHLHQSTDGN